MLDEHLSPDCEQGKRAYCGQDDCPHVAKKASSGFWFITMGHAGFNSPANNAWGYQSQAKALAAHRRYAAKRHASPR